jgi:hypothetical protein
MQGTCSRRGIRTITWHSSEAGEHQGGRQTLRRVVCMHCIVCLPGAWPSPGACKAGASTQANELGSTTGLAPQRLLTLHISSYS